MRRRRVVAKALSLAVIPSVAFAGCGLPGGGAGGQRVHAGTGGAAGVGAAQGTHIAPSAGAGAGAGAAAAPAPPLLLATTRGGGAGAAAPARSGGRIELHYQREGGTSTASLVGPDGPRSVALSGGVALFEDLSPGAYALEISYTSEAAGTTPGVGIGGALDVTRYGSFDVGAGQSLVLICDQTSCASS